jgi:hypothetical protein
VFLASWPGRSQAATVEADICIYGGTSGGVAEKTVQDVDYERLKRRLIADKQVLTWLPR